MVLSEDLSIGRLPAELGPSLVLPSLLRLDGDLFTHLHTRAEWLPTWHLARGRRHRPELLPATSFADYGINVYADTQLERLLQLIQHWSTLFSLAPETIPLSAGLVYRPRSNDLVPRRRTFSRDELLASLDQLSQLIAETKATHQYVFMGAQSPVAEFSDGNRFR